MRIIKIMMISILLLVFLSSCQKKDVLNSVDNHDISEMQGRNDKSDSQENNNERLDDHLDVNYNYTVKGESPDGFSTLIFDNPIDLRQKELLEEYDGSNRMIIEVSTKYEQFWLREMDVAYNQLLKLVDGEDKKNLIESQTSWENYMKSKKLVEENFYANNKYNEVGTLRTALSVDENAEETKARAYSLLEYLYIITGEINLVFSSEEW